MCVFANSRLLVVLFLYEYNQRHLSGEVLAVASCAVTKLIASASTDTSVRLWHSDGTPCGILRGHVSAVRALAFHPDGSFLASGSDDQSVRVWDPQRNSMLCVLPHAAAPVSVHYGHPRGGLVTLCTGGILRVWKGSHVESSVEVQFGCLVVAAACCLSCSVSDISGQGV